MKYALPIIIVILLAGAGLYYFSSQPKSNQTTEIQPSDSVVNQTSTNSAQQNLYGAYVTGMAANGYKNAAGDTIVLFFYADWCPTCRPVDAEFKNRIKEIPAGIEIYRIHYNDQETDDTAKALAEKYGVTYQHTFVQIDKYGNEITKWNGGGLDNLLSKIK